MKDKNVLIITGVLLALAAVYYFIFHKSDKNPYSGIEKRFMGWVKYIEEEKWNVADKYAAALYELERQGAITLDEIKYLKGKYLTSK